MVHLRKPKVVSQIGRIPLLRIDAVVSALIDQSLAEDCSSNDITTDSLIPPHVHGIAVLKADAPGILAGIEVALAVFQRVDSSIKVETLIRDGTPLHVGDILAKIEGRITSILRVERTALNFLQHLSGITTETGRYVEAVEGTRASIVDTRKTAPGLRSLQKYAVMVGGGKNHRMNLADGVLIKDNHIEALRARGLSLGFIVKRALEEAPPTAKVEVEVTSTEEAQEALEAGAHTIMLDNMSLDEMRRVVAIIDGRALIEASGGITLETVRKVAETGVDIISVGALTHSVKALDISLDLEPI